MKHPPSGMGDVYRHRRQKAIRIVVFCVASTFPAIAAVMGVSASKEALCKYYAEAYYLNDGLYPAKGGGS